MSQCSRRSFLSRAIPAWGASVLVPTLLTHAAVPSRRVGPLLWSRLVRPAGSKSRSDASTPIVPASDGSRLYLATVDRVLAINLETGEPAWPSGQAGDDGALLRHSPASQKNGAMNAAVLAGGRLIALTGSLGQSEAEALTTDAFPTVSAFDVAAGEGKLLWRQGADGDLAGSGWRFAGFPVAGEKSVWIAVRGRTEKDQLAVAELDLSDGGVRRVIELGELKRQSATDTLVSLALNDGQVLCLRPDGVEPVASREEANVGTKSAGSRPVSVMHHSDGQVLVGVGLIYFVASSGRIQAVDAESGTWRWRFDLEEESVQICGLAGDLLICQGRRLWALDAAAGTPRRRWGFLDERIAGRAAVRDGAVAWSTRDELAIADVASGGILDRVPLTTWGPTGGDVFSLDRHLVLIGDGRVSVFDSPLR